MSETKDKNLTIEQLIEQLKQFPKDSIIYAVEPFTGNHSLNVIVDKDLQQIGEIKTPLP